MFYLEDKFWIWCQGQGDRREATFTFIAPNDMVLSQVSGDLAAFSHPLKFSWHGAASIVYSWSYPT